MIPNQAPSTTNEERSTKNEERSTALCAMPGCANLADEGRLLCRDCRMGNVPVDRIPSLPVASLCGLNREQAIQARMKHKKRRTAHNRLPRITKTCICGCGRQFEVPQGGVYESRKYFSMECKKRHYSPDQAFRRKYEITPEFDAELRKIYQNEVLMSSPHLHHHPAGDLAVKYNVPRWKVTRRAQELCLLPRTKKEPYWSDRELEILHQYAHFSPHAISLHLKKEGFGRSETGIAIKLTRIGARQLADAYSGREASLIFGVDGKRITNWIAKGYLAAERRGTKRAGSQGGDIWTITTEAIREFIKHYPEIVDFRKVDKYFVAQLL